MAPRDHQPQDAEKAAEEDEGAGPLESATQPSALELPSLHDVSSARVLGASLLAAVPTLLGPHPGCSILGLLDCRQAADAASSWPRSWGELCVEARALVADEREAMLRLLAHASEGV